MLLSLVNKQGALAADFTFVRVDHTQDKESQT